MAKKPEDPIYYPPVGFFFKVQFIGLSSKDVDTRFQSVSGLNADMQTENLKEGGENRFEHVIPVRTNFSNLTLKRGLVTDSAVIDWAMDAMVNLIIDPVDMIVNLQNEKESFLMTWNIIQAWPKKWSVADFNAEQSSVLIETFELEYQFFTINLPTEQQ